MELIFELIKLLIRAMDSRSNAAGVSQQQQQQRAWALQQQALQQRKLWELQQAAASEPPRLPVARGGPPAPPPPPERPAPAREVAVTSTAPVRTKATAAFRLALTDRATLRKRFVLMEILRPPVSMQPPRF